MNDAVIVAHLLSVTRGIAAGLVSIAVFHVAGLLLLPRRWEFSSDGHGPTIMGAGFFVLLCWVAISSRNLPLIYVIYAFAAVLCLLVSARFSWVQSALRARLLNSVTRRWTLVFCAFYTLIYVVILPPVGGLHLSLAPEGNVELVTYARYAQQLLVQGTPDLDFAAFGYLESPASAYFLAWQSMFFGRNTLEAALPTLFAVVAMFGAGAAGVASSMFGLSARVSVAIACVTLTSPFLRWVASEYGLSELLGAAIVLYMAWLVCRAVISRAADGPIVSGCVASFALLSFVEPVSPASLLTAARSTAAFVASVSPLAVMGWPSQIERVANSGVKRSVAVCVLPLIPLFWASLVYGLGKVISFNRTAMSESDRHLARALVGYVLIALAVGNIAVDAVSDPGSARITAAWRNLEELDRLPFRGLTLKMDDTPGGVRTALALYFLRTKKTKLIGSDMGISSLRFDAVSKNDPLFVHNVDCQVAGHDNTVKVPGIGCLMLAPPSIKIGKAYPFNQTFLFMSYEDMARTSGGRLSIRPMLPLKLTADPESTPLDRDVYVNLSVNPLLTAGEKPQRMSFTWGRGRRGETSVGEQVWVSLPVRSDDWTGNRLWTLAIDIEFPDGRRILFQELSVTDVPRGRLVGD